MNYNALSVSGLETDYSTLRNNRAKLDTGLHCNYNCEFCYYLGDLDKKTEWEVIKKRIDKLYEYGITEVDLSGGESAIHRDWFKILDYCNEKFEHISCLTNGSAFANEKFLLKSKEHGLKEILFSLHGCDAKSHEDIVRIPGSWKKILKAIDLCKQHNITVRLNCTVYQRNYKSLVKYGDVVNKIKPLMVNFLTLNYWCNNKDFEPIDYVKVTDKIKQCIDKIKPNVKYINVRYTPFCFMQGYEKHVCNQIQHVYDVYDWNKEIYDYDLDTTRDYNTQEKIDLGYKKAISDRIADYKKPKECIKCKFFHICDGVENQVSTDLIPVDGEKITNVNHYRKTFYETYASSRSRL